MNNFEFGEYLRKLRKAKKLTIRQLDMYSGVSHSYISQVERGNRGIPSPDILQKIAKPLGVDYEELMVKAGYIEEVKDKLPSDFQNVTIDSDFIDLVNGLIKSLFSDDSFSEEDYLMVGLPGNSSISDYINSLPFAEKLEFLKDYLQKRPETKEINKMYLNYIKAISGDDLFKYDLADDSIVDKLDLYYEGMELTKEEKLEFLAIVRGIFSARRALKEKK